MSLPSIGLIGKKKSGKNSVANVLVRDYGYQELAFADPLRELTEYINPIVGELLGSRYNDALKTIGYDAAKEQFPEVRRFLQELGVGVRNILGEDTWTNALKNRIWQYGGPLVVTDVRFPNEASLLLRRGFKIVNVHRPGLESTDSHVSETALDDYAADYYIKNSGSLELLTYRVEDMLSYFAPDREEALV